MCTALSYTNGPTYFGRNLDLEIDYPVDVVITPRNFEFEFRNTDPIKSHYAIIGMAMVANNYPLYFDACNEKGLGIAGTAFFGMGYYEPVTEGKVNIATFEIIQYILAQCATIAEVKKLMENVNLDDVAFSPQLPVNQLHWLVSDASGSIVIESTKEKGLKIYDNPFGVLTNCPDFEYQNVNVSYYLNNTGNLVPIRFPNPNNEITLYSRASGTIGLPGGADSVSRFVRAAFTKFSSTTENDPEKNVAEFFHILQNVQQVSGEDEVKPGEFEITIYTDCMDLADGIFYYSTYYNQSLNAVKMHNENLDGTELVVYPVHKEMQVNFQN